MILLAAVFSSACRQLSVSERLMTELWSMGREKSVS